MTITITIKEGAGAFHINSASNGMREATSGEKVIAMALRELLKTGIPAIHESLGGRHSLMVERDAPSATETTK